MIPLMETIRAYLGWCPAEGQTHRQMQPGSGMHGDIPDDGGRRAGGVNVKIDSIAKEELWRSVATFGISLYVTAFIITTDYFPLPSFLLLPLPLMIAAVVTCVMVWYRRKENLVDPNPLNILRHALGLGRQSEKRTEQRRVIIEKVTDAALLVMIFLIYLYASLAYSISQVYWLPVLIIVGILLARIVFTDGGVQRVTVARSFVFYLIVAGILLLRYVVLGYPVTPLLQAIALVGIVTFPILYIWERRRTTEETD